MEKAFGGAGVCSAVRQLHDCKCELSAEVSGFVGIQGEKHSYPAANLLPGGSGADESGIYAAAVRFTKKRAAEPGASNHLWNWHPGI